MFTASNNNNIIGFISLVAFSIKNLYGKCLALAIRLLHDFSCQQMGAISQFQLLILNQLHPTAWMSLSLPLVSLVPSLRELMIQAALVWFSHSMGSQLYFLCGTVQITVLRGQWLAHGSSQLTWHREIPSLKIFQSQLLFCFHLKLVMWSVLV